MASGITNKVHVARNGAVIGAYDLGKIGDLLDNGQLLPTDHYFDNPRQEWLALSEIATAEPTSQEFKQAEPRPQRESSSRRGGRSGGRSRSKGKGEGGGSLLGWIACLFALGVAAGIWAWAANLQDQLQASDEKAEALSLQVENLKKENQMLNEITPPGRVRGIITYEPSANQVAIMSGATVGLYKRADVEAALQNLAGRKDEPLKNSEAFDSAINLLKSSLSSPIEITLTDSNGRLDMVVPSKGDYVLVASAAKTSGSTTERYFWLIGFQATDQPSSLVLMNEKNAITTQKAQLEITNLKGFQSGAN